MQEAMQELSAECGRPMASFHSPISGSGFCQMSLPSNIVVRPHEAAALLEILSRAQPIVGYFNNERLGSDFYSPDYVPTVQVILLTTKDIIHPGRTKAQVDAEAANGQA